MKRLLGTRFFTRLLLLVCSLSLVSILLLSKCGLESLKSSTSDDPIEESQASELSGEYVPLKSIIDEKKVRLANR